MNWGPIEVLADKVKSQKTTASELVEKSLKNIENAKKYNAILQIIAERAKKRAKEIDQKVKKGEDTGRLAGVPFIAKDNFLTFGSNTTAASHILEPFESPYQSTAIERLENEGAIVVAKANLDSFAHGSSTENSAFEPTLNPHDKTRVPGGSSGGSAAAVALNLAPFALGTDTGGSIRLPASYCGVVGLKPTYGLVSRYGVVAMGSSTDVIGPITNNVTDAALVLDIISGRDKFDSTTIDRASESYTHLSKLIKGKRIGVIKEYFNKGVDKDVSKIVRQSIKKLEEADAKVKEVSIPSVDLALACYYIIVPAEISSNLSRYDGQRFGLSYKDAKSLDEVYNKTRELGFEDENKRRIMIGTYVLSSGYYDAYYKKAQIVRTKLINDFKVVFKEFDFLIGPTAPTTAFKLSANTKDPLAMYLADIMTVVANLTGIPSINIPAGVCDRLPVGLQLMADQCQDRELLGIAKVVEDLA